MTAKFKQVVFECLVSPKAVYATMQKCYIFLMLFRRSLEERKL